MMTLPDARTDTDNGRAADGGTYHRCARTAPAWAVRALLPVVSCPVCFRVVYDTRGLRPK
jgi:hypothetical protein